MSWGWKTYREQKTGGTVECATFVHPRHLHLGSCRHQEKVFITTHEMQVRWRIKYLLGRFFMKIKRSSVSSWKLSLGDLRLKFEESNLKLAVSGCKPESVCLDLQQGTASWGQALTSAQSPVTSMSRCTLVSIMVLFTTIQTTSAYVFFWVEKVPLQNKTEAPSFSCNSKPFGSVMKDDCAVHNILSTNSYN